MINYKCKSISAAVKSMIRNAHFRMKPITVTNGSPDTVNIFELEIVPNQVVKEITDGSLAIQTSDTGETVHNAPQSDLSPTLLEVTDATPIQETVDNGSGKWEYTWTVDLVLAGGTVEAGCRIIIELESPFNNLI